MFRNYRKFSIKKLIKLSPYDIFFDYISDKGGIYPYQKRVSLAQELWREFNIGQSFIFDDGCKKGKEGYSYSTLFSSAFKK
ncbi:MAG: hypothetical protein M5U10_10280 [Candidatus Methanoperedens sp.]|nr:hypothetical protein [Candidatus Methanoperedens sp.]